MEDQRFRQAKKGPEETVDEFVKRLRELGRYCGYADLDAEIIRHVVAHCETEYKVDMVVMVIEVETVAMVVMVD